MSGTGGDVDAYLASLKSGGVAGGTGVTSSESTASAAYLDALAASKITGSGQASEYLAAFLKERYISPGDLLTQFNPQFILAAGGNASAGIGADPAMTGPCYVFVTCPDINLGLTTIDQLQDQYSGTAGAGDPPNYQPSGGASSPTLTFGPVETAVLGLGTPMAPAALAQQLTGGVGFIKLFTNMCTGYQAQDLTMDMTPIAEAWDGAKLQMPKSTLNSRQDGTLVLEMDDWSGTPVLLTAKIWQDYIEAVTRGYLAPKKSNNYIQNRVLDYACSIYAFHCLADGVTIEWGARWTGCLPLAQPHSAWSGSRQPTHSQVKYNLPFSFQFYEPMDPAIFAEFNQAGSTLANGDLAAQSTGVSITSRSLQSQGAVPNPLGVASPNRDAYYLVFDSTAAQIQTPGF